MFRERETMTAFSSIAVTFTAMTLLMSSGVSALIEGFYTTSCPNVEDTIYKKMQEIHVNDNDLYPVILRLHFHDCFIRGCDASVLLAGSGTERTAPPNARLEGFGAVDVIKAELERLCPRTVSCADILAYAARDSVRLSGGPSYKVLAGRRDGTTSSASEAAAGLPGANMNVDQLKANFQKVGLSLDDMIILSGAHTIGEAACVHLDERIYKYPSPSGVDPNIPKDFVDKMKKKCSKPGLTDRKFDLDTTTSGNFDSKYYSNLMNKRGTLQSDQVLFDDDRTRNSVIQNSNTGNFFAKFGPAMQRMGNIMPLEGSQGQIRLRCSSVN